MASRQVLLLAAAAIAVAFLPALTSAVEYQVGGDAGWSLNYPANWTDSKTFRVGDTLVFAYPKGKHTVTEVGGEAFKSCNTSSNPLNSWTSGNDTVTLDKAGKRWFFCSVADHCSKGMKLVINATDGNAPAPSPAPVSPPAPASSSSPASSSAALNYKVGGAVAQAMVAGGAVIAAVLMF